MQKCTSKDETREASRSLQSAMEGLDVEGFTVDKLNFIALARMGLCITAKYMAYCVDSSVLVQNVRNLFEMARRLCENTRSKWPK